MKVVSNLLNTNKENQLHKKLLSQQNNQRQKKLSIVQINKNKPYWKKYFNLFNDHNNQQKNNQQSITQSFRQQDFHSILPQNYFSHFSLISNNDMDRIKYQPILLKLKNQNFNKNQLHILDLKLKQSRGIAVMLGLAICDALGAPFQFFSYRQKDQKQYDYVKNGFNDIRELIQNKKILPRDDKVGVWTDDFSMAIAISYNLILSKYKFTNPQHLRFLFHLWWYHGLGNGGRQQSVGQGRNIKLSMDQYVNYAKEILNRQNQQLNINQKQLSFVSKDGKQEEINLQKIKYVNIGNKDNNGNGSLMRLAPYIIAYHDNSERAMKLSAQQSLTTHNGVQAQQCCRLMAKIIIDLINRKSDENWKDVLLNSCNQFQSISQQVKCLALSKKQTQQMFDKKCRDPNQLRFKQFNQNIEDRNWNWRDQLFQYSNTRYKQNIDYIGSYCMDGLAMALHVVYHTNSFKQCAIKCANMGGDCDTVGAIAGQIAGAVYGISEDMLQLYSEMSDFGQGRFEVFLLGKKLVNMSCLLVQQKTCYDWFIQIFEKIRRWNLWRGQQICK